ncbi:MAG: tRNA isopentenyl-2-thiomethyl-A-37 hydroxylase MiaE [Bradymonadaceae bacterium]
MLNLARPTAPDWYERIADHLDLILIDHAHLEKRAASTALSLIFRYTGRPGLPRKLSEVVQEEMDHFSRMLDILDARGVELQKLDPAPYASILVGRIRKQEPETLLDKLLVAALIEARSCERFSILAANVEDVALAAFYEELFETEALHHTLYTGLAREYFPAAQVKERLGELAAAEVEALEASAGEPRLHSL